MGLMSYEYIYDGEVFQSPEHRGPGMKTGKNNLIQRSSLPICEHN